MRIWKYYNRRNQKTEWRARFEYNNKTFRPTETTQERLLNLIGEIRGQEKLQKDNKKYNLGREVVSYIPSLSELFEKILPVIQKSNQKILAERVFKNFLELLPPMIKVNEIGKTHFQTYIDYRRGHLGKQSKKPIKLQTIYKELYAISSALKKAHLYYDSLEKWQVPSLPDPPKGFSKQANRTRFVTESELSAIIAELMKTPTGKQTHAHSFARVRLAHQIEFGFWTGLRRKEICSLTFSQYDEIQNALLNVKRFKTDTVTKFFPLARRAAEIIETRRKLQKDTDFIFSAHGLPVESAYRTLKKVCEDLDINYGRFRHDGFILHDLPHNFGTEILQNSDIETARELLGHSNIAQKGAYLHTSNERLREAVRKRDKINYDEELLKLFTAAKSGKISGREFTDKIKKLFDKV